MSLNDWLKKLPAEQYQKACEQADLNTRFFKENQVKSLKDVVYCLSFMLKDKKNKPYWNNIIDNL